VAKWPAFVGPAYASQSPTAAADRLVNWYPESLENSGEVKAKSTLYPTPGLLPFTACPTGPVGALFSLNDRCYALAGTGFYEIFADGSIQLRGNVAAPAGRPSIASNGTAGHQIFLISGGNGYIFDLNTFVLSLIADANFPQGRADDAIFVDGYFAVRVQGSTQWQISKLLDGTVWPGTSVAQRTFAQDNIAALVVTHKEIWILGSQTSEVWYDSGATFPFQPITGVFLQEGCGAQDSVANLGPTLYWLSQNIDGARKIVRAAGGYVPERISTHAIEFALSQYETVADAIGWAYQDQGHEFYVITFPTANATWCYDATTGLWHERGAWDSTRGQYGAQVQTCHAYVFGKHLVGSRIDGQIFEQDITCYQDADGGIIRRMRRGVHLTGELRYAFYAELQIDMQVGNGIVLGAPDEEDPQVMLRWSNDGGRTWSVERRASSGRVGQYGKRVRWRQLGRGRDRLFEVAVTSAVPWRLVNAYLEADGGVN
jgi:hypothetical protein